MTLDLVTLYFVNLLYGAIFASATILTAYIDPSRTYWRSWALCYVYGVTSLFLSTTGIAIDRNVVLQAGNILIAPTFFYYYEAIYGLTNRRVSKRYLYGSCALLFTATLPAITNNNVIYSDVVRQIMVIAACAAAIHCLMQPDVRRLTSRFGLLLSAIVHILALVIHLLFLFGLLPFTWATHEMVLTVHLLAGIVFTVLNGTFLFAMTHERNALENREEALRDALTGAYNRRAFDQYLSLKLSSDETSNFLLMQLDLDHFKSVDDQFGHPAGDRVLIEFVHILSENTPAPHFVARLGGEEFAIIANDLSFQRAIKAADQILRTLETKTFEFGNGQKAQVTTSAGLYYGNGDDLSVEDLMASVDRCLYEAKRTGRNRFIRADLNNSATASL
ncbi:GGDEF domain-containing protein [Labrenzia sp. PHM005]|uniref:GGDEF domain-containing protein n=1 Tax=Labrenzia sp. PHM005 TaxID=2590016 RepID=UPI00113FD93C|nr:GGDEF domain-containing protein [Labrenzia sp. PHM005]QDG76895.1 GGDEF domain-containing protein [Labrenzia sp. PHM005]